MRIILLAALGLTTVLAGTPDRASAELPSPPGHLALAIAVADTDLFIDEWVSTPSSHAPVIHRTHHARPERTIYIAFIISGEVPDATGHVNVDVDFLARRPDGKIDNSEQACAHLRTLVAKPAFGMADPALTYTFESTDPEGLWRIEAIAHDRIAGSSATAGYEITLAH